MLRPRHNANVCLVKQVVTKPVQVESVRTNPPVEETKVFGPSSYHENNLSLLSGAIAQDHYGIIKIVGNRPKIYTHDGYDIGLYEHPIMNIDFRWMKPMETCNFPAMVLFIFVNWKSFLITLCDIVCLLYYILVQRVNERFPLFVMFCNLMVELTYSVVAPAFIFGYELLSGSNTKRRTKPFNLREGFKVHDFNRIHNIGLVNGFYRSRERKDLELFGFTMLGEFKFPYPVYCDYKTAYRIINRMKEDLSPADYRRLMHFNDVSASAKSMMIDLYKPVLYKHPFYVGGFVALDKAAYFNFAMFFLYGQYVGADMWFMFAFAALCTIVRASGSSILYVICEELFNGYFGVLPVIFYETVTRFWWSPIMTLLPMTLHLSVCLLPFPFRVLIHWVYNNFVEQCVGDGLMATVSDSQHQGLMMVQEASYYVDVIRKISKGDIVGLGLSLGMRSVRITNNLQSLLGVGSTEEAVTVMREAYFEEEDGTVLLNWEEGRHTWLFSWIPKSISKSPTFAKMVALTIVLFSSQYFETWEPIRRMTGGMTLEDFSLKGDLLTTVTQGLYGVFKGITRIVETGDYSAFFEMPRDARFIMEANALLRESDSDKPIEDVLADIGQCQSLIHSRTYLTNTVEVQKLTEKLRDFVDKKHKFLLDQATRRPPLPILLNGPPGTGKTTFMGVLVDFLNALNTWKRFPGDVTSFNINDKYPTSTGANTKSRFLLANDIPALYTEFPKMDILPLDIVLQMVFDIYPLYFRAAAVEDKGKILNDIKYFLMSSNHYSFRCPGETEKLQRRLKDGIIVDVKVKEGNEELTYEEMCKLSTEKRNDLWSFEVLEVECKDHFITFRKGKLKMNLPQFMSYVEQKCKDHDATNQKIYDSFQEGSKKCSCGMPVLMHRGRPNRDSIPIEFATVTGTAFKKLSTMCDKYFDEVVYVDTSAEGFSHYNERESYLNADIVTATNFMWMMVCAMAMFINRDGINSCVNWGISGVMLSNERWVSNIFARSDYLTDRVRDYCEDAPHRLRLWYMFKAKRTFLKLYDWYYKYANYIKIAAGLGTAYAVYRKLTDTETLAKPIYKDQVEPSSMEVVNMRSEMSFPLEKRRAWNKDDSRVWKADLVTSNVGPIDLADKVKKNLEKIQIRFVGFLPIDAYIFFLTPEWVVCNKHYVLLKDGTPRDSKFEILFRNTWFPINFADLRGNAEAEFFAFKHHFPIKVGSVHQYLPALPITVSVDIRRVGDTDGVHSVACCSSYSACTSTYPSLIWKDVRVENGMCGQPVLAIVDGGACLAGLVGYGQPVLGYVGCSTISRRWFDAICCKDVFPVIEEVILLNNFGIYGELSENADIRNVDTPYLCAVGTMPGPVNGFHSSLRRSRIYDAVAPKLTQPHGIPSRVRLVNDNEYSSAFTLTFTNVGIVCDISNEEIDYVSKQMVDEMAPVDFVKEKKIKLSPMTLAEAVFGNDELGVDRVDFKTSCGYVLRQSGIKNKYDMFIETSPGKYAMKAEVKNMIDKIQEAFDAGHTVVSCVEFVFKDEIRTQEKLDKAKIRLFSVLCAAMNFYGRMIMMPLIVYLLQFRELSECYGAMNAGSSQWNDLANRLQGQYGWFNIDMDFSSFDTSHGSQMFSLVAQFFFLLSIRLGYEVRAATHVYFFVMGFKWQLVKFLADLFLKFKGMPSGVIITLILNSLANSALSRIAFRRLVGEGRNFRECVRMATVGDDNASSIIGDLLGKFDMVTISAEYRKMGYIATPADKKGLIRRSIPFSDLSFVKRKFVWSEDLQVYVAPIEKDSIYKAFCFESKECGVSSVQRLIDVSQGGQREAFLHGKVFFDKFQSEMLEIFTEHQMTMPILHYDDLKFEYEQGVFSTYMC